MASIRTSIARVAAAKQAWAPSVRTFASTSPIAQAAAPDSYPGPYAEPSNGRPLNRYLIVVEDYNDAGALARRMEVRERHLEHAQIGKAVGRIGEYSSSLLGYMSSAQFSCLGRAALGCAHRLLHRLEH